jgi:PST family polysaccharide transporter
MSLKKQTIRGIFWSGIQNWGSQAGSFIVFLILARLLSPQDFGLVALANIFINFMQIFLDQGFAQALIQKQEIEDKHINTAFWTQVFIGCLLTVVTFTAADMLARGFNQPKLYSLLQVLSFLFIISAFSQTQIALLKQNFDFKTLAVRALLGIIISGIVGIFMALWGYGVWSLVGQQLTYETVGAIILWQASDWRPKWQFSRQYLFELFSFSLNLLGFNLVEFFNQRTDSLLIGYFLGEVALGYYAISHRILQVMTQLLIGTLNQVVLPTFSRLQDDSQRFLDAFYQATQFTSLIAFPVFCAVIILSPELVVTLFGEKWSESIPIIQILAFTGILRAVSFFQRSAFIARGKPLIQFKLGLLNATFNLIACLIAIRWGILAVAVAYVMSDYLVFPIGQWLLSKLIQISWKTYLDKFLAPVICTSVMVLTLLVAQHLLTSYQNPQGSLVVCSIIGIVVYGVTLRLMFPKLILEILALLVLLRTSPKTSGL